MVARIMTRIDYARVVTMTGEGTAGERLRVGFFDAIFRGHFSRYNLGKTR